ncbi:hypothetical protein Ahy_A05g022628 [Arachis hypogaea]|uniref:SWIM-type domain-containing protein n=1 Tax=Arachis hypogaea TaxID=3818 RepID=A0A445D147_ARAHY|nr:hypothetical protein Ahy_A05g022628 [Arachis hypogaea]
MKSMIDNRQKLMVYQGILPPVQQSRLEGLIKLSRNWVPHWFGDEKECLYEIQGWPTNMVGDLRNHTCTCRFWLLTGGMPCMHAIVAIQDKHDKRPEEYCQEWLRMKSYKRTYAFNVNPVKEQYFWEKIPSPTPVLPQLSLSQEGQQQRGEKTRMRALPAQVVTTVALLFDAAPVVLITEPPAPEQNVLIELKLFQGHLNLKLLREEPEKNHIPKLLQHQQLSTKSLKPLGELTLPLPRDLFFNQRLQPTMTYQVFILPLSLHKQARPIATN